MKRLFLSSIFLVACTFIQAQERQIRLPQKPAEQKYHEYGTTETGYWCSVEYDAGTSLQFGKKNIQGMGLSFTNGYRFSEYLRVGVGAGVRYYINNNEVRDTDVKWAFPLYANLRGNIMSMDVRDIVPYYSVNVGGVVRDGFFISPTIGLRIGDPRSAFLIGLSYSYEDTSLRSGNGLSALSVRLGYEF